MAKNKELADLVSTRTLVKIQDHYCAAMGFGLSINKPDGAFIVKPTKLSKLWEFVQENESLKKEMLDSLLKAFKKSDKSGQSVVFERLKGTSAFVSPININGKIYAYFVGGMVRHGNPDLKIINEQANLLKVNLDDYLDAYLSLPLIPIERYIAAANLIKIIAGTITSMELIGNDLKNKSEEAIKQNRELFKNLEKTSSKLDQSENIYQSVLNSIHDGAYLEDSQNTIIDINNEGAKLLGFSKPEELIGKNLKSLYMIPTDLQKYQKLINEKGKIKNWIAQIKTPSGEERFLEINAMGIKDINNQITKIQGIFRDINSNRISVEGI